MSNGEDYWVDKYYDTKILLEEAEKQITYLKGALHHLEIQAASYKRTSEEYKPYYDAYHK